MEDFIDIGDGKYHYSFGYYSGNKWLGDGELVLVRSEDITVQRSKSDPLSKTQLVRYNVKSGELSVIAEGIDCWTDYTVFESTVYFVRNGLFCSLDTATNAIREYFKYPSLTAPHITSDGRYVSVFSCSPEVSSFFRVDTESGSVEKLLDTSFPEPFPYANHGMICPTDGDVIFFAHEGNTRYVSNRLWLYEKKTGRARNIARQSLGENGELIDCFGHESWNSDGSGIYFVKYVCSEAPTGICYADRVTGNARLLYSAYKYWHVCASENGRYIAADTANIGNDRSRVVLIDTESKSEREIDTVKTNFKHPCHPHPQVSRDGKRIIYHLLGDDGMIKVRLKYIEKDPLF